MLPGLSGIIKSALVGIIGALFLVSVLSGQAITINAMEFSLDLQLFDQGYTVVNIPPLGTIRAKTHQWPLLFGITLKNINLEMLGDLVSAQEPEQIFSDIQDNLRRQITLFLARTIALSFLGGFGAGLLFFRRAKKALLAGLIGLAAFSILVGSAAFTYDESAFREPEFEGIVEAAPWLLGVADEALAAVEGLDAKMKIIADNLMLLFSSLHFLGGGGGSVDGELKVLHVSDMHNNPIGVSLAKQMAASFGVDIIIDTGDATDYGTPVEADLVSSISEIGLPWVFVPGNHDSPSVIETLSSLENVYVLSEDVLYLEELDFTLAGVADPASASSEMTVRPREEYKEAAARLRQTIAQSERRPSMIIAHHLYIVEEFIDTDSVLLYGHSHQVSIKTENNAILVNAGTSGGAGIRGLMSSGEVPYSMILLHFNRWEENWVVTAADIITVNQLNSGFVLDRRLLGQPAGPEPELEPEPEQ